MSEETKGMIGFAIFLWAIIAVAAIAVALGNPTAINAILGCTLPALFFTYVARRFLRDDRERQGRDGR